MFKFPLVAIVAIVLTACARSSSGSAAQNAPTPGLPIASGDYPEYGAAPDLSWIAGRLVRSWLVRSSPAGECTYVVFSTSRGGAWGGRIAISGDATLVDRFPDGDMVVVTSDRVVRGTGACGTFSAIVKTIAEH